jgi:hypothetical protein
VKLFEAPTLRWWESALVVLMVVGCSGSHLAKSPPKATTRSGDVIASSSSRPRLPSCSAGVDNAYEAMHTKTMTTAHRRAMILRSFEACSPNNGGHGAREWIARARLEAKGPAASSQFADQLVALCAFADPNRTTSVCQTARAVGKTTAPGSQPAAHPPTSLPASTVPSNPGGGLICQTLTATTDLSVALPTLAGTLHGCSANVEGVLTARLDVKGGPEPGTISWGNTGTISVVSFSALLDSSGAGCGAGNLAVQVTIVVGGGPYQGEHATGLLCANMSTFPTLSLTSAGPIAF